MDINREISDIFINLKDDTITTAGWDGQIISQRYSKKKMVKKITQKTAEKVEISIMRMYPEEDFIATVSYDLINVWSYKNLKLIGMCRSQN